MKAVLHFKIIESNVIKAALQHFQILRTHFLADLNGVWISL